MSRTSVAFFASLVVSVTASVQAADLTQLDREIAAARERWDVPGLAVAIVKDDQVVLAQGYGLCEHGKTDAVDADTLFAIASNTKAFTATLLAQLVEEGRLSWQDPVRDHLPYFQLYDPYVSAEMRIEDLLCHRSGLGTFSGDLLWWGTGYSAEEVIRRARYLRSAGPFRAHYGYSNLMFLAAGETVAEVAGRPWSEVLQERILDPLEMSRSLTSVRDLADFGNVATPHRTTPDGPRPLAWQNWDTMAAAGGIISSVNDMAKWIRVQLNRGEIDEDRRLFSAALSRQMWAPQTIIPVSESSRTRYPTTHFRAYGLGWALSDYKGRKLVGHGGGYDGMNSRVLLVPEDSLGIVVLTNSMTGIASALAYRIADAYLGGEAGDWIEEGIERDRTRREAFDQRIAAAIAPRAENTKPSHPLKAYAGTYTSQLYGDALVQVKGGHLTLRLEPARELVADLTHLHFDTFVIHWRKEFAWFREGTAQFLPNAAGDVVQLKLNVPNDDLWFDELDLQR